MPDAPGEEVVSVRLPANMPRTSDGVNMEDAAVAIASTSRRATPSSYR